LERTKLPLKYGKLHKFTLEEKPQIGDTKPKRNKDSEG
jgi:hypothetical protein